MHEPRCEAFLVVSGPVTTVAWGACLSTKGAMKTDRYITPNNVMNRKTTELFSEFARVLGAFVLNVQA